MVHPAAVPAFNPFSCPKCKHPMAAQPGPQPCAGCARTVVLRAGARVDPAVRPPQPDLRLKQIKTTSAGMFVRNANLVAPAGVLQGTLDPITGMIPMDTSGVAYNDIVSIAVWRELDIVRLVLSCVLLLPIAFGLMWGTAAAPVVSIATLPLLALIGWFFYRLIGIKKNMMRVVGSMRILELQFDVPIWRRRAFHDELLRRAGLPPSPIP